ncbi:ribbon-helix-helix domain-containing protein [Erythrobacter aureus]|nr:ribbon-helix-helix domain-containing protein [Erythrobacter aureus]
MSTQKSSPAKPTSKPRKQSRAKARDGKKAIVGYFSPELSKQIQILAIQEDKSMQALVGEALDMLLENRGMPPAGER